MAKWEYVEVTNYIQRKNHTTGKYTKFSTVTEADDVIFVFRDDIRRLSRNAMPGYERKVFLNMNTITGQAENATYEYDKNAKAVRFYYFDKIGNYKMLREARLHSVEGPAIIREARDSWQPMTYRNNNGPWITPPVVPAKPEQAVYYLFGEEYSYEEWNNHPFVLEYKLRTIENTEESDDALLSKLENLPGF